MKKLAFALLFLCAALTAYAQNLQTLGGYGHKFDRLAANKFFRPPVYADTSTVDLVVNLNNGDTIGAVIYRLTDNELYVKRPTGWRKIGGDAGPTLYSGNGTLSGDRTVNGGGQSLTFSSLLSMAASGTGGYTANFATGVQLLSGASSSLTVGPALTNVINGASSLSIEPTLIDVVTGGGLDFYMPSGTAARFVDQTAGLANVKGKAASAIDEFITRGQMTDSLNGRGAGVIPTFQQVTTAGNSTDRFTRFTGVNGVTGTGAGLEVYYEAVGSGGVIQSYDRTAAVFKPLYIGSTVTNHVGRMLVNGATDDGVAALQVNGPVRGTTNTYTSGGYEPMVTNLSTGHYERVTTANFLAGETLQAVTNRGNHTSNSIYAGSGAGAGYVQLSPGGGGGTGWVGFYKPDNTRLGYIGESTTNMLYTAENGAVHWFTGGRIVSQGSLHIGADNPDYVFSAEGSAAAGRAHSYLNNTNTADDTHGLVIDIGSTSPTSFPLAVNSGASISRLAVRADGNVGIGTASPSYKLDVSGTVRSAGAVDVFRATNDLSVVRFMKADNTTAVGRMAVASTGAAADLGITLHADIGNINLETSSGFQPMVRLNNTSGAAEFNQGLKTNGAVSSHVRTQTTATPFTISAADHIVLCKGMGTAEADGVLITLPDPTLAANEGRELIFIEQSASSWASSELIYTGMSSVTVINGHMTIRAAAGRWYLTSKVM